MQRTYQSVATVSIDTELRNLRNNYLFNEVLAAK